MARNPKFQYAREFDPYSKGVTMEELKQIHRQLSKVMNQRMVRLEQTKSPITGESYTFGAYDQMRDYLSQKGRNRFSESWNPKMSKTQLQKEVRVLQGFEAKVSSRVAGQKAIERQRIKTMEKEGLDPTVVSNKDFYDFLNSQTYQELIKSFNSEDIVEEYNRIAKEGVSAKTIERSLSEYMDKSRRMSLKGIRRALSATTIKRKIKKRKK